MSVGAGTGGGEGDREGEWLVLPYVGGSEGRDEVDDLKVEGLKGGGGGFGSCGGEGGVGED